jgi:uncharacterized protein YneF (UPF0154 family)
MDSVIVIIVIAAIAFLAGAVFGSWRTNRQYLDYTKKTLKLLERDLGGK